MDGDCDGRYDWPVSTQRTSGRTASATPDTGTRTVLLHRRVAVISPDKVEIRPARAALVGPLIGLVFGLACCAIILLGLNTLSLPLLGLLLLVAVILIPFAFLGVVYAIVGAHVVVDRAKGSATWQQGMIGLGIGTEELVPFAKIAAIVVEEAGSAAAAGEGRRVEEVAQWEIVLHKESGKRLIIGQAAMVRSQSREALDRAVTVARAVAQIAGAELRTPTDRRAQSVVRVDAPAARRTTRRVRHRTRSRR